jgi:hypothetical protein
MVAITTTETTICILLFGWLKVHRNFDIRKCGRKLMLRYWEKVSLFAELDVLIGGTIG